MGEERRHNPRVRAYRPVRLHQPGVPKIVETLTKDLAVGGLRCVTTSVFPVSSDVQVELALSRGEAPLCVLGRSMWFRTIPHSEQCELGLSFVNVSELDKRRLSAYIDHLSQQPAPALQ